jgi:tRNA G18 (ribose-2'-O)-methylase SpoU
VVEGARTIRYLLEQRWPLESVLLTPSRYRALPDLVSGATAAGAPVYVAGQEVFDHVAGFHIHRGALALARRPEPRTVDDVSAGVSRVLAIEAVSDHENIGSLFRNAAAFGVGAVILDPASADPLYRRSIRVSLGHVLRVPFARARAWPDEVVALKARGYRVVALTPSGSATVDQLGSELGDVVVMVGAEGDGLSDRARAAADLTVRIPVAPAVDSVNVATAAAIALHRLSAPSAKSTRMVSDQ